MSNNLNENETLNQNVSIFGSIYATDNRTTSILDVLNKIKSPDKSTVDLINQIRSEKNKDQRNTTKTKLSNISFAGTFESSRKSRMLSCTKIICLDFDDLADVHAVKEKLRELPFVLSYFLSPSGNGLKVLVKANFICSSDFKQQFKELSYFCQQELAIKTPDSTRSDINGLCYFSHDPNLYINANATTFGGYEIPESYEIKEVEIDRENPNEKSRIELEKLVEVLESQSIDIVDSYQDWLYVGFGLAHFLGEDGRQYYHRISALSDKYSKSECDDQYDNCLREFEEDSSITKSIIYYFAKQQGIDPSDISKLATEELDSKVVPSRDKFWYTSKEKGTITISYRELCDFLYSKGFGIYKDGGNRLLVRVQDNIVEECSSNDVKDFVFNHVSDLIQRYPDHKLELYNVIEKLRRSISSLFSADQLDALGTLQLNFLKDEKNSSYLYFSNGCVVITKSQTQLIPYGDLIGNIWKNQIIDKAIDLENPAGYGTSDFYDFILKITKSDEVRLSSLKSIFGYAIHQYNDVSNSKAVVLCDEQLSDNPCGGTGKGICVNAIAQLKNKVTIDGKRVSFGNQFLYQNVKPDTGLLFFDDVERDFDFEKLFSQMTEGLTIDRKYRDSIHIPFEDCPKIVITTNYALKGDGPSHERRKVEFELAPYFSDKRSPADEYGKQFFREWDGDQWNQFYLLMIDCVQGFLKDGLVKAPKINIGLKKLIQEVDPEFMEFMAEVNLTGRVETKGLKAQYDKAIGLFGPNQRKFNSWVKKFCEAKEIEVNTCNSNGLQYFNFGSRSQAA